MNSDLVIPFLICLRKQKIEPAVIFDGIDELSGITFDLVPADKNMTNESVMQHPNDDTKLKFIIRDDNGKEIHTTDFKMKDIFTVKVIFDWQDKRYTIKFK